MELRIRAAFLCDSLGALLLIAFGARYLLRREYMPYHAAATGMAWADLTPGLRALLLGLLRGGGGALLAAGIGIALLLAIPFRAGEAWARWGSAAVGLTAAVPAAYATYRIRRDTAARPPLGVVVAGAVLFTVGLLLAW
jgi:hypothetical protein